MSSLVEKQRVIFDEFMKVINYLHRSPVTDNLVLMIVLSGIYSQNYDCGTCQVLDNHYKDGLIRIQLILLF